LSGTAYPSLSSYYKEKVEKDSGVKAGSASLKHYSPWLASFNESDHEEKIEIPGQYSNLARPPALRDHATIRFFHPTILIMNSMRRPCRITMVGSLGKESMWLAKSGEDLRMDQRIQQLFQVFNHMFEKDPYCIKYDARIETYHVEPMSTSVGLLEWVESTIPLSGCYKSDPGYEKANNAAKKSFEKMIVTKRKAKSFVECLSCRSNLIKAITNHGLKIATNPSETLCRSSRWGTNHTSSCISIVYLLVLRPFMP
jgi:phosphatidylinositol kinase/protein kinase (PI-3  family)